MGRGGAFLLVSPLLGPLPTRSSRGEDGELDAATARTNLDFGRARWMRGNAERMTRTAKCLNDRNTFSFVSVMNADRD